MWRVAVENSGQARSSVPEEDGPKWALPSLFGGLDSRAVATASAFEQDRVLARVDLGLDVRAWRDVQSRAMTPSFRGERRHEDQSGDFATVAECLRSLLPNAAINVKL